jgi:hypothetical protein
MSAKCKPQIFQSNKNLLHSSCKVSYLLKLYDIRTAIFEKNWNFPALVVPGKVDKFYANLGFCIIFQFDCKYSN